MLRDALSLHEVLNQCHECFIEIMKSFGSWALDWGPQRLRGWGLRGTVVKPDPPALEIMDIHYDL